MEQGREIDKERGGVIMMADNKFEEEDRLLSLLLADPEGGRRAQPRGTFGTNFGRRGTRRGKQQLYTRLLSPNHPALLDDESPGMVDLLLSRLHSWDFNAFLLDRFSRGHSLSTLCLHLFHREGLLAHFSMDPVDVFSFFKLVERGYHSTNPYHTALHAADVTQAISVFCQQPALAPHLSPLELLATIVAAVCHDLDHPGVNEKFLVSTSSHLAVLYDNVSVLENHHWRSALACFVESGLTRCLTETQFAEFTDLVRALVLATDISRQQEFLTQFRYFLDSGDMDMSQVNHRHFILQIAIKCADISNPCRAWLVSRLWSLRACEEFFRQGDRERELGLSLTPICDRFNATVAKVQVGFYRFVAEPLFREWHRFLTSPLSAAMLDHLYSNQATWEQDVVTEETVTPETPTDVLLTETEETIKQPTGPMIRVVTATKPQLSSLQRRLSLPATDPLHRMFDAMTHPDCEVPRSSGHLRRNFSLTDRRRSSLLRGLHGRSSLKPTRGRLTRPSSVCLENTENLRPSSSRTLQARENRLTAGQQSMEVSSSVDLRRTTTKQEIIQTEHLVEKENSALHLSYERLTKRRGSAPSNLVLADCLVPNNSLTQRHQTCLSATSRRGSLPSELLTESLPKQLRNRLLGGPQATQKNRPGLLRRRSMGPELLSLASPAGKDRPLVQKYLNRPF